MRWPKQVTIGGVPWRIVFDTKVKGGEFRWRNHTIKIQADYSDARKWLVLIHEITEAILVNNGMRFSPDFDQVHNGDYLYSFNHKEFEILTDELSGILREVMKEVSWTSKQR